MFRKIRSLAAKAIRLFETRASINPIFDSTATTSSFISEILLLAKGTGKQRIVARNLVGAMLQSRFSSTLAGDNQAFGTCEPGLGDFVVGDTAFCVVDIPTSADFERCLHSLRNGFRVYLLVPDEIIQGTRLSADFCEPNQIAVESIESFVARSIDVSSSFESEARTEGIRALVNCYNARIGAVSAECPILIATPRSL